MPEETWWWCRVNTGYQKRAPEMVDQEVDPKLVHPVTEVL